MMIYFAIAIGGALGAVARHGSNRFVELVLQQPLPISTLIVNVFGSFLIGLVAASFAHYGNPSQEMRLFLTTGFLGGLTTFSTFSLDTVTLIQRGEVLFAGLYVLGSVILSFGALLAALALVGVLAGKAAS